MWSRKEICFAGCNILAIILLLYGIRLLSNSIMYSASMSTTGRGGFLFGNALMNLLLTFGPAALLFVFSDDLAGWMAGQRDDEEGDEMDLPDQQLRISETKGLLHVGITVVALLGLIKGLYHVIYELVLNGPFQLKPIRKFRANLENRPQATIVASVLILLLSLLLLLGGRYLAGILVPERGKKGGDSLNNGEG